MRQLIAIFFLIGFVSAKGKYCDPDICPNKQQHVACGNSGVFFPTCPSDRGIVELTEEDIQLILDNHNMYRNKIANGDEQGFLPAVRMATMVGFKGAFRYLRISNFIKFSITF
jgi:hypothetical protein